MAEDMVVKTQMVNPCCAALKEKNTKLEASRSALRQGVKMQNEMIDKLQSENNSLKLVYKEEKEKADNERKEKEELLAFQVSLENEICSLKARILASQENTVSKDGLDSKKEVIFLQTQISEGLTEINLLKERLENETSKAEYESKRALEARKETQETLKLVEAEKRRANEEKRLANAEREKARENLLLLDKLKAEANELRSKLVSEGVKFEDVKKKLEVEKQKTMKEKKRADISTAKAEEQRKLTEFNQNKVAEVNSQANQLNQQLEEHRRRMEKLEKERNELLSFKSKVKASAKQSSKHITPETTKRDVGRQVSMGETVMVLGNPEKVLNKQIKKDRHKNLGEKVQKDMSSKKSEERTMVADINFEKPIEKKHHTDELSLQLKGCMQIMEGLMKEVKLVTSMKSSFPSEKNVTREDAEMKFLKKKLKFEKIQVKHFKHAAKLETVRNNMLQQEICCLKQDLVSFTDRLNVLNNFTSTEGTHNFEKTCSRVLDTPRVGMTKFCRKEPNHLNSQNTRDHLKGNTVGSMKLLKNPLESSQLMVPMDEGILTEFITGITSKLESLPRGCNKSIQSSAVNSSTASFSNRHYVGSQERGSHSACTSLKLTESNSEANLSRLSGQDTRIENNKQLAVVVENSARSPIKLDVVGKGKEHKKRKRVYDGIDSIGYNQPHSNNWHLEIEQKVSMLHDMISQIISPLDKTLPVPDLVYKPNSKTKAHKRRKVCNGYEEYPRKLLVSNDNENRHVGSTNEEHDAGIIISPADNVAMIEPACLTELNNSVKRSLESIGKFEGVSECNYLHMLDLDNYVDEERYRRAIEEPMSPITPETILSNLPISVRGTDECVGGERRNERSIADCPLHIDSSMVHSCKFNTDMLCVPFGTKMPDSHSLCDKDAIISFHRQESPICKLLPKYCIIFSDINASDSISRILQAIESCMAMCEKADLTGLTLQKILSSFVKTEVLSHREKSCVLLSLELHIFSGMALGKLENLNEHFMLLFHGIAEQMQSVITDAVTRNILVELCLYGELLILIEEFLLDWRVMELNDTILDGVNPLSSSPTITAVLNGAERVLKSRTASSNEFMAVGIMLASICVVTNNIGFLCMTSYNMLRVLNIDSSLRLTILHVFACICGPKYFKLERYHLVMTVIKSLVTCHEKASLSAAKCPLNEGEVFPEFSFTKCPFSEDAISIESATSLLVEELQKFGLSNALLELVALEHMNKGGSKASCSRELIPSDDDATLCRFTDVLSLLELISFHMSWDWTCKNTICQLWEILDSWSGKNFAIVIIILLGKLGRIGIDACGYEHSSIANLRNRLSNFLIKPKIGFPIQISVFNSLLGLLRVPYEELINMDHQSSAIAVSEIGNVDCLRKWFFVLNNEQRSLVADLNRVGE